MRLLLVEDDKNLGTATAQGLRDQFAVDWVMSAEEAEEAIAVTDYSMIVLDVGLPGKSGLEFLENLRQNKKEIAVLLLTARDAVYHRVEGLNKGADDYLVKPFDLDELLARCTALLRRSHGYSNPTITHRDIIYETSTGHLQKGDAGIILTARERAVFDCLIRNIDRAVSKERIMQNIYDWSSEDIESNTIEVYISSLRRKLGADFIKTIRGVGYMVVK
ncbi:MAG: DNA-binding response regulator [Micavibrio sp.]|nr:DNA-binding response regulator [Micavibrio sp.]|tara:strand:+ start:142 stop:798 length:657 start_codon:yes stop_codon:yes gene_type:complete